MSLVTEFLDQSIKNPDNIAVFTEDKQMTYKQINEYSNCIAYNILKNKLEKGNIALVFEQSVDMIVAVFSVLKAGKTYIPLSEHYPDLRMKHILKDSQTEIIITNNASLHKARRVADKIGKQIVIINMDDILYENMEEIQIENSSVNEIAYILYTSGSTGNPKGVMQTEKNILHFAKAYAKRMNITTGTRMTVFSSFCHDAAVIDIFSGILHGATLYPKDIRNEIGFQHIVEWLIREKINIWHSVPTLYRHFTSTLTGKEQFDDLKYIVLGGESVVHNDIERFQKFFSKSIMVNLYGQSESSYNSSQFITGNSKDVQIHLGDSIEDTQIWVVDENNEEVMPLGIGEIVIASPHVALGYWGKEEETLKVFDYDSEIGSLYWTGDIGRLEIDNRITWLGRKDFQVKVRGYRVELEEIESCIMKIESVQQAVVVAKEKGNDEYELIAYFTSIQPITKGEIYQYIVDRLPNYMIPNNLVEIQSIPLTASGKVDRKELLKLEMELKREVKYEAPRNDIEAKLVELWEGILGVHRIGIQDNFFELGGHSLKATMLSGRIQKELYAEVGVRDIFERPTIKELVEKVRKIQGKQYEMLVPLEKKDSYAVSSAQKRVYVVQMMNKESTAYNMPIVLELTGKVDRVKIEKAIVALIQKHEVLRSSFHVEGKEIIQKIQEKAELQLQYEEVKGEEEVERIVLNWIKPFELDKAPLMRVGIINKGNTQLLVLDVHHIISDGTTTGILAEDFVKAYQGVELKAEDVQYKEYAQWEKEQKEKGNWEKQKKYWKKEFEGEVPVIELPMDGIRLNTQDSQGESIKFDIEEKVVRGLKAAVGEIGGTLYMGLMAGYSILMSKYSGQEDIVIGSPIAGRTHAQMQKVAGMFVNTLAIRTQPEGEKKIKDYLLETKQKLLGAYDNQEYPYEELVEEVKVKRDFSRNPLFDVMLILQNTEMKDIELNDVQIKSYKIDSKRAKFDITLNIVEYEDRLFCEVEFRSNLYSKNSIGKMMKHYIRILKDIGENKEKLIEEIELLEVEEKQQLLKQINNTTVGYGRDKTIVELFEEQVEQNPESIAVIYREDKLTYEELNEKANQLAGRLRQKGVKADSVIGIMPERSLEMIIGILGILKSGGAYLPIDPQYPAERIEYMLQDSGAEMLLTTKNSLQKVSITGEILSIEDELLQCKDCTNLKRVNKANDLAYIIYTSGSTGRPKAVMIEHRAVNNFIKGITNKIPFTPNNTMLAVTTICFDIFLLETLLPLTKGVKVVITDENAQRDMGLLTEVIIKNNVDMIQMTPSRMQMILSAENTAFLKKIKDIMIGGEAFSHTLLQELKKLTDARIYNMYGPTETTVWSTIKDLTNSSDINIGKPIANTYIYIVDKNQNLQPVGVPGELCIAGDGLARGYFNRIELTEEKFVQNPYKLGTKMYYTGDIARWLPDENIEFLGRIDHQVKIRGHRIELGEIESSINKQEGVKESVVLLKGNNMENQYLCAYLVLDNVDVQSIKNSIKKMLPEYMVPASYIIIDEIPLTANGKIDRQALLSIEEIKETRSKIPPRNFHDNTIAEIWKEVLALDEVYIQDDFFELGGNSINIIQVANRIKQVMEVEISVADLMVYKTILELSEYIANLDSNSDKQFKHVFKINKSSSKKNIFIVHGADGDIFYYRHLAKLLEDEYSVYGIQPRGLNGEEGFPDSFFEMLRDYLKEIRMIQEEGPYIMAGYCIGGYLSYDIVNILEMQGEKVEALLQLDQEAFIEKKHRRGIYLYRAILEGIDLWRRITRKDKSYTLEKFAELISKAKPISKERQMEILKERDTIRKYFGEELTVNSNYGYLGIISAPTLVIKAEDNKHILFKKSLWLKMVKGTLEYYETPGDHETVLLPPYVDKVADIIREYLCKMKNYRVK